MEAGKTEIRARHYSYRMETAYVDWVRRFIAFHNHANPRGLDAPTAVKTYLDYLSSLALLRMLYELKGTCQDKNTPVSDSVIRMSNKRGVEKKRRRNGC